MGTYGAPQSSVVSAALAKKRREEEEEEEKKRSLQSLLWGGGLSGLAQASQEPTAPGPSSGPPSLAEQGIGREPEKKESRPTAPGPSSGPPSLAEQGIGREPQPPRQEPAAPGPSYGPPSLAEQGVQPRRREPTAPGPEAGPPSLQEQGIGGYTPPEVTLQDPGVEVGHVTERADTGARDVDAGRTMGGGTRQTDLAPVREPEGPPVYQSGVGPDALTNLYQASVRNRSTRESALKQSELERAQEEFERTGIAPDGYQEGFGGELVSDEDAKWTLAPLFGGMTGGPSGVGMASMSLPSAAVLGMGSFLQDPGGKIRQGQELVEQFMDENPQVADFMRNYLGEDSRDSTYYSLKVVEGIMKMTGAEKELAVMRGQEEPTTTRGAIANKYMKQLERQDEEQRLLNERLPAPLGPIVNSVFEAGTFLGWGIEAGLLSSPFLVEEILGNEYTWGQNWGIMLGALSNFSMVQKGRHGSVLPAMEGRDEGDSFMPMYEWLTPDQETDTGMFVWQDPRVRNFVTDWTDAWDMSIDDMGAALRVPEEFMGPEHAEAVRIAKANASMMGHHGIVATAEMFTSMLELPDKQLEAARKRDDLMALAMNTGDEDQRLALEVAAAHAGAEANKLKNTHPLDLYDQHANWWNALPAELIADPANALGFFFKMVGLSSRGMRMARGGRLAKATPEQAERAVLTGKGLRGGGPLEFGQEWLNFWKSQRSERNTQNRNMFRGFTNLFGSAKSKEDWRLIMKGFSDSPREFLTSQIPVQAFTSPEMGMQAVDGFVNFARGAPAAAADHKFVQGLDNMQGIWNILESAPSLQGDGNINIFELSVDLYTALQRHGGAKGTGLPGLLGLQGPAALPDVPVGAKSAKAITKGNEAVIQFLGEKSKVLGEIPSGVGSAEDHVRQINRYLKQGVSARGNLLQYVSDLQRGLMSNVSINFDPSSIVYNGGGNRFFSLIDGLYGGENLQQNLDYIARQFDQWIPDAELATFAYNFNNGSTGTLTEHLSEVDPIGKIFPWNRWIKTARNKDEMRTKGMIWARAHEQFMRWWGEQQLRPVLTQHLNGLGIQDPKEVRQLVTSWMDAGKYGGKQAFRDFHNNLAQGRQRLSMGAFDPNYREIFTPRIADGIDEVLRTVTPQNIDAKRMELEYWLGEQYRYAEGALENYGNLPGRKIFTKAESERDIAQLLAIKNTYTKSGGENTEALDTAIDTYQKVQENVNATLNSIVGMNSDHGATPYIFGLWQQLDYLKDKARLEAGEYMRLIPGFPHRGTEEYQILLEQAGVESAQAWSNYQDEAMRLIDEVRQWIDPVNGGWKTGQPTPSGIGGPDTMQRILDSLGFNADTVFEINAQGQIGSFGSDPAAPAAMEAFRKGLDKFETLMFTALQGNPTADGFDMMMDARRDVQLFGIKVTGPQKAEASRRLDEANKLLSDASEAGDFWAGESIETLQKQADAAKREFFRVRNEMAQEFARYAYGRYLVGAGSIALQGNPLPPLSFRPALNWGDNFLGPDDVVELVSRNYQNPGQFFIRTPQGYTMPIDQYAIPDATLTEYNNRMQHGYQAMIGQLERMGLRNILEGGDLGPIDNIVKDIMGGEAEDIWQAVRMSVYSNASSPINHAPIHGNVEEHILQATEQLGTVLRGVLPQVADTNMRTFSVAPSEALNQFNRSILPAFDNMRYGAGRFAEEMTSFDTVSFQNEYLWDQVLSLRVPFHFWFSRMGKNIMERMMFEPHVAGKAFSYSRAMESDFRLRQEQRGQTSRFENTIDTGIYSPGFDVFGMEDVLEGQVYMRDPFFYFTPITMDWMFNGWVNPDVANGAADLIIDGVETGGFPGLAKGFMGNVAMYAQVSEALGWGGYPWQDAAIDASVGQGHEVAWADMGKPFRLWGYIGQLLSGDPSQQFMGLPVQAFHAPYTAGRSAGNDVMAGNMPEELSEAISAYQELESQGREGELPEEFFELFPNVQREAAKYARKQALEDLILMLVGVTGARPVLSDKDEEQRRLNYRRYQDFKWPENPAGGQDVRNTVRDPNSPHYMPGIRATQANYAILNEDTSREEREEPLGPSPPTYPYTEGFEYEPYADKLLRRKYFDERNRVFEKYNVMTEEEARANPDIEESEWYAWKKENIDAPKQAELDEIDERHPTMAQEREEKVHGPPTKASLYGANPQETAEEARDRLWDQALAETADMDPGDFPEEGTSQEQREWYRKDDAHKEAAEETFIQLMMDPEAASQAVYGRPLPREGGGVIGYNPLGAGDMPMASGLPPESPTRQTETTGEIAGGREGNVPEERIPGTPQPPGPKVSPIKVDFGIPQPTQAAGGLPSQAGPATRETETTGQITPMPEAYVRREQEMAQETADTSIPDVPTETPGKKTPTESRVEGPMIGPLTEAQTPSGPMQGPPTQAQAAAGGGIAWGITPEDALDQAKQDKYNTPDAEWELRTGWEAEKEKKSKKYRETEDSVEQAFGEEGLEVYLGIPEYNEEDNSARDKYYAENPEARTIKMWVDGRPEPFDEDSEWIPDNGNDYERAKEMFGDDIWELVEAERGLEGRDRSDRYWDWNDWWYAKLPDDGNAPSYTPGSGYSRSSGYSRGGGGYSRSYSRGGGGASYYRGGSYSGGWTGYDAQAEQEAKDIFGDEAWSAYKSIPDYETGRRSQYYRDNPESFLVKTWVEGRPKPFGQPRSYNYGRDYAEAQQMFGEDIWDLVVMELAVPDYDQNPDAWIAFRNQHPQYEQWSDWWYGLLDQESGYGSGYGAASAASYSGGGRFSPSYRSFSRGGFSGGWSYGGGSSGGDDDYDPDPWRRGFQVQNPYYYENEPPTYRPTRFNFDEWRSYLR